MFLFSLTFRFAFDPSENFSSKEESNISPFDDSSRKNGRQSLSAGLQAYSQNVSTALLIIRDASIDRLLCDTPPSDKTASKCLNGVRNFEYHFLCVRNFRRQAERSET